VNIVILGSRGFDTLEGNIAETLLHMGHDAHIVDVYQDLALLKLSRVATYTLMQASYGLCVFLWKRLCNYVVEHKPDLIIVTYREVVPEAIADLKRRLKNTPVVHLNPDHISNLGRQYILMSPYDALFTKEPFLAENMRRLYGLNAHYLPESFNPRVHMKPREPKPDVEAVTDVDLVVIANLNPYRVLFLERLLGAIRREVKIVIYGGPKPLPWVRSRLEVFHAGKPLVGAEKAAAFYGSRIALNTMHPSEFHGVNCRFFEAMGSGAFLLTEHRPVIPDLAIPDAEVVTFRDVQEAAAKIEYYLDHDADRISIAEAGYKRASRDHTYEKRIDAMMAILGGGGQ